MKKKIWSKNRFFQKCWKLHETWRNEEKKNSIFWLAGPMTGLKSANIRLYPHPQKPAFIRMKNPLSSAIIRRNPQESTKIRKNPQKSARIRRNPQESALRIMAG
jgi:hypothetical protein